MPCTERYETETASFIVPKLWEKVQEIMNFKCLRNIKYELRVELPKIVLARSLNCTLNM